jgi:hypothetical protein
LGSGRTMHASTQREAHLKKRLPMRVASITCRMASAEGVAAAGGCVVQVSRRHATPSGRNAAVGSALV